MKWLYKIVDEVFERMQKEEFAMSVEDYYFPKEMIEKEDAKNKKYGNLLLVLLQMKN
ncbi:hypothetical protein ACE193_05570 [Bernardetia sp. OM2101]|uniref:hypothetical protein n=1 Tax=Bernardetia sp. OM2101 TaxID=3344876 RepID=UPI0035D11A78